MADTPLVDTPSFEVKRPEGEEPDSDRVVAIRFADWDILTIDIVEPVGEEEAP